MANPSQRDGWEILNWSGILVFAATILVCGGILCIVCTLLIQGANQTKEYVDHQIASGVERQKQETTTLMKVVELIFKPIIQAFGMLLRFLLLWFPSNPTAPTVPL